MLSPFAIEKIINELHNHLHCVFAIFIQVYAARYISQKPHRPGLSHCDISFKANQWIPNGLNLLHATFPTRTGFTNITGLWVVEGWVPISYLIVPNSCYKLHVHALAMNYRSTINLERKVAFDKTASDRYFALKGTWE